MVEVGVRPVSGPIVRRSLTIPQLHQWLAEGTAVGLDAALRSLATPRLRWAGLALDRPLVMGVVNATPDSFFDGGRHGDIVEHAKNLLTAGADMIDVGGESTRPGAEPVAPAVETHRVIPVIEALASVGATVSIDTRHPETMSAALAHGATIVNDVAALQAPGAIEIVARAKASVVLMHMQGRPQTMQRNPTYADVVFDVFDFLEERVAACVSAGIPLVRIMVDTGIGFGKTVEQNCALIAAQGLYRTLGCGVLLGASRKGFIGAIAGECPPDQRLGGSLAAALAGIRAGADIVRVHDVAETVQALRVFQALG